MLENKIMNEISEWVEKKGIKNTTTKFLHKYPEIKVYINNNLKINISYVFTEIEFSIYEVTAKMDVETKSMKKGWYRYQNESIGYFEGSSNNDYKRFDTSEEAIDEIQKLFKYFYKK